MSATTRTLCIISFHYVMKASRVSVESVTLPSCCLATFWSFFSLDSTPTTHTSLFFAFTFYVFHDAGSVSAAACRVAAVSWFEFQNLSDWLPVLTADDLMETLLSGALKNRRMIYNETQPLSLFRWRGWGGGGLDVRFGFSAGLLSFYVH